MIFKRELEKQIADLEEKLANANYQLEGRDNEIAELKATYKKQRNKRIDELQKENAELKADNDACKFAMAMSEKVEKQLREEIAELKDQLTTAKEIICEYVRLANLEKEDTVAIWQLYHKAEQFLKDSEVEK